MKILWDGEAARRITDTLTEVLSARERPTARQNP